MSKFRRVTGPATKPRPASEKLVGVGIVTSDGVEHGEMGRFRSHYELRAAMGGYADPRKGNPEDWDGFWTSEGRFLDRREAVGVAVAAGQLDESWLRSRRELLSSDLTWEPR